VVTTTDVNFAADLLLTVVQDGNVASPIVNGQPLSTALTTPIPLTGGTAWAPNVPHIYTITVTFPNGAKGADTGFMNDSVEYELSWEAVSVPTP
jgi:hypothetical protein